MWIHTHKIIEMYVVKRTQQWTVAAISLHVLKILGYVHVLCFQWKNCSTFSKNYEHRNVHSFSPGGECEPSGRKIFQVSIFLWDWNSHKNKCLYSPLPVWSRRGVEQPEQSFSCDNWNCHPVPLFSRTSWKLSLPLFPVLQALNVACAALLGGTNDDLKSREPRTVSPFLWL